jgi:endogenous inhibitor of DNA gyrase (YacG/DUF329 family)
MKHLCPICRRPTDSETDSEFPFCSERCRLVDLGNWATERYVVSEPVFEQDEIETGDFDAERESRGSDADDDGGDSGGSGADARANGDSEFGRGRGNSGGGKSSGKHDANH